MDDKEKMLWMFKEVHGEISNSCNLEISSTVDDNDDAITINVVKDGNICWSVSKTQLIFDYLTEHL